MELNQKLSKASPEDIPYEVFTCRGNTNVRTWSLKRGESVRSKRAYFQEVVVLVLCPDAILSEGKGVVSFLVVLSILKKQMLHHAS